MLTDITFTMRAVSVRNSKFQVYGSHRWSTNLFFSPSWVAFAHLALLAKLPSDILWYDKSNVVAQTSFAPRQTAPPRSFDASSDEWERLLVFGWRTSERRRHPFRAPLSLACSRSPLISGVFYHAENFPSRSNRSSPKAIIICSACIMVIVQISHQRNRISMLSVWGGEWVRWCAVDGERKRRFGRKEKEGKRKTCREGKRWEIRWGATGKRENTLTLEWETLEEENERGRRTEEEEVAVVMGVAPPVFGTLRKLYATIFCPLFSQSALEKMIALIIFLKDRFSCQCITSRH